ncbi:MAG TPA: hypothetical protein VHX38_21065 [Pseudonocardiaceae bacterium]|nr:hypothetical protein [Pseudonocardiaceae bacterium]
MTDPAIANNLRSINNALNTMQRNQNALGAQQAELQQSVNQVKATGDQTQANLLTLAQQFDVFQRQSEFRHNLQVAETQIVQVKQQLETEYGHYKNVRRLATGTLQALDAGITSHGTMRQVSEELMLLTPQYWLAPALVAVAAWIRDDPALAAQALAEANRRSNDKTSLFFALVLRRHQRNAAAARWLGQYTARQDPAKLSPEFMVILDAVSVGAFGHESKTLVMGRLMDWYGRLSDDQATVDRQVTRWAAQLDAHRRPVDPRYHVLPQISSTWPQLKDLYEGATVHGLAEQRLRAMFDGPIGQSEDLRVRVDNILEDLVSDFDAEEAPLRHREQELKELVKAKGDQAAADKAIQLAKPLREATHDFLTLISNAAVDPQQAGTSPGTQRFAVALAKDWISQASGRLEAANIAAHPAAVRVDIDSWQHFIDSTTGEEQLVRDLSRHIDRQTERAVSAVRFSGPPLAAAICAGLTLLCALWAGIGQSVGLAVFFLLVAIGAGGWAAYHAYGLPARRAELRQQGERRKTVTVAQLRGGIAELIDLRAEWERELALAARLRQYLEQLNGAAFAPRAPDQLRGA